MYHPPPHRALLYKPAEGVRPDSALKHGASAGLLLLDFGLSRAPVVTYHVLVGSRWVSN